MLYLLDADTLITCNRLFYPMRRWQPFWEWLLYQAEAGTIKIPIEQYEEITAGTRTDELVAWLREDDVKSAIVLQEAADPSFVSKVTSAGYAPDLTEIEIEKVGRDPFLISYGLQFPSARTIVTFENSAPSKSRGNRKIPDVCNQFSICCSKIFDVINDLDFTFDWKP